MGKRFRGQRRAIGFAAAVVGVLALSLAAWLSTVAASVKGGDRLATRSYLLTEISTYSALAGDVRRGQMAAEELAARLGRDCPGVAASAPASSPVREKLLLESAYGASLASIAPLQATLRGGLDTLSHLRWSDRMLTLLVHLFAQNRGLLALPVPDLCADWRAAAASGYRSVPATTTRFLDEVGPRVVASNEGGAKVGRQLESDLQALMRPYEGPTERVLARRLAQIRARARRLTSAALLTALRKIELALGVRNSPLVELGPFALATEPPADVLRAGGERLSLFYLGRSVAAQSGCLACHRLGENGNAGPGPDLTHVGSELSGVQIARALVSPKAPMPSFKRLPRARFRALVEFLALLN